MSKKKWINLFIRYSFILLSFVAVINFTIDPLWTFSHTNSFNNKQEPFNERQQKINKIYFSNFKDYDSLLLGNSRVTYINSTAFNNMKVFNMGAGNMFPQEYEGYINTVKEIKHQELKYIIIGMDFFSSSIPKGNLIHKEAYFYLNKSTSFFYRYKTLLSLNSMKHTYKNLLNTIKPPSQYYTRDNIRLHKTLTDKEQKENINASLYNAKTYFKYDYEYNFDLIQTLKNIKRDNPNTKFIIFTTPIMVEVLEYALIDCQLFDDYAQWLQDVISVFGEIYHFGGFNEITLNEKHYFDAGHYYPYVGKLMIQKINNNDFSNNFGLLLNKNNIEEYIKIFKEKL